MGRCGVLVDGIKMVKERQRKMCKERIEYKEYKKYVQEIGESLQKRQYGYCKALQKDLLNLIKEDERKAKRRCE